MSNIIKFSKESKNFSEFTDSYIEYLSEVFSKVSKKNLDNLEKTLEIIRKKSANLFVIGNGGGAATATTMANDLGFDILKKTKAKKILKIYSLSDNNAVSTAIANDTGFENLFVNQLKIHFKKNDYLLIFSASGNSKNLVSAAKWVKKKKGKVIGILGFSGGKLKSLCDLCIHIPTEKGEYGPVEDIQLMINHMLAHWFQTKIKK
ncbi:MAG: sugar isomerase [Candidatus Marinimicrobia bacterium]|nr:sugar isomerase [Candidatus Neomarinimicrobiota bacterium]|tara:strand:- start:7650 stop:8264 length:615 start_codon:yes stop_codon:yes gene_type:complete